MWSRQMEEASYPERMQIVILLRASRNQVVRIMRWTLISSVIRPASSVSDTMPVFSVVAGDHLHNLHVSNPRDSRLMRNCFSITSMSELAPSATTNQGTNHVLNKSMGNPFEQTEVFRNSQHGRSDVGNGCVSFAQLADGGNLNFQPDFNSSSQACDRGITTRVVLPGFGNESERNMMLYDRISAFGNLNFLYKPPVSNASLKLELPSCQSAESADSVGTQRSSITNPSPLIPSNNILSEAESYGSNASNFLDALMQVKFCFLKFSFSLSFLSLYHIHTIISVFCFVSLFIIYYNIFRLVFQLWISTQKMDCFCCDILQLHRCRSICDHLSITMQIRFSQDAHPSEELEQVRLSMDLIEQLMVHSSGNINPDVASLLLSPQKSRWGKDSDPTTPLAGRTFSDHSEEASPMCQTGNWDGPQASAMHSFQCGGSIYLSFGFFEFLKLIFRLATCNPLQQDINEIYLLIVIYWKTSKLACKDRWQPWKIRSWSVELNNSDTGFGSSCCTCFIL